MIEIIINLILWSLVLLILGLGAFYAYYLTSFDYMVILRKRAKGRSIVYKGKGKINKDDETSFKIIGSKIFKDLMVVSPPDDSVEVMAKGKKLVQGWILENNQVKWGKEGNLDNLEIIEPLTQNQRAMLARQVVKAKLRKGFSFLDYVMPIAGMVFILAIFVMGMVYWEDITQPTVEALNKASEVIGKLDPIIQRIEQADSEQQSIGNIPSTTTTTLRSFNEVAS